MAEESKARLVRCLRCDSLIKEFPRYSFFKCGSCGAVLQAKKKEQVSNVREHRLNPGRIEKRDGYVDDYISQSKNPMNYWAHQRHDHHDLNINRSRSVNSSRESKFGVYSPRLDNSSRSLRLKGVDRDGFGGFYKRSLETIDEGPSSYRSASAYGYCKPVNRFECLDVPNGVRNFERDRAEVLKKLDELKDQLSRSHDMPQRPTELVPIDNKMDSSDHLGSSIGMSSAHLRSGQYHYSMNNDENVVNFYRNYHSVKHARPHPQQRTYGYEHILASYMNQEEALYHLTACSCLYCYDKNRKGPLRVTPAAFGNRGSLKDPCNSTSNHYVSSNRVGQHYLPRPQSNFEDTPVHLWPSDIGSDIDGFGRRCIRKVVLTERKNRLCHPIASGAPFITCYNCFELLQMPRKLRLMVKNEQQVRCGACSTVISFIITNKRLVIRDHAKAMEISVEADDISNAVAKDCSSHFHGHAYQISANFSSDDYDHSGYEFQSMDRESNALSMGKALNSVKARDMQSICSSSPSISEDENSPNREEVDSIDQPIKSILAPPPAGSPLQEHFDYSTNNRAVNRFGKGNHSNHSDQEIVVSNNGTTRQSSFKEASLPTEMEVAFNEYSNTETSQDSRDGIEEDDQPKMTRGGESFFANIIKNNFKESSKYNQIEEHGKRNVSVNGHPLPERVVKKAEKTAGRIQPGQYWYDFRAGFWGVLGGPCLGIIPPHIEEFNYPMPENCAGGSSGRHESDFEQCLGSEAWFRHESWKSSRMMNS